MIGYAVTIKCINVERKSQAQDGVALHEGSVDIAIASPEGDINLQIPFVREHSLDGAAKSVLRRVANWARYIAQTAEEEIGGSEPVAEPGPVFASVVG